MLKVEEAKKELAQKSLNDIQTATAWTWASRAAASYQNSLEAAGNQAIILWSIGEEYFHEAVEHAALVEDKELVTTIKEALESYQEAAYESLGKVFASKDDLKEKSE